MEDAQIQTLEAEVERLPESDEELFLRLKKLKDDLDAGTAAPLELERLTPIEEIGLPKILGHQLTVKEWEAFETWVESSSVSEAARKTGLNKRTVANWRKSTWWNELFDTFIKERQQDFHAGLLKLTEDALEASGKVLRGELEMDEKGIGEGKYASAIVNMVTLMTRLGKAPLQDNRSITNIDSRSVINTGTVHISREKIQELDQDEMLKMITGEVKIE